MRARLAAVALAAMTVAACAAPAHAATPRFSAKIIGNSASGTVPKHHFVEGDGYSGLFRDSRRAHTFYDVCWFRPGHARLVGCVAGRTGRAGVYDHVFLIAPHPPGRYVYRWIVGTRTVAHWRITIGLGD